MWRMVMLLAFSAVILSCGGGSGGSGGGSSGAPASTTTVSGSVQAPNGQVAFNHSPRFLARLANLFTPSAYASITGTSPVPDGTLVQLARFNADGTGFTILATTPTAGGTYSFNLTTLGLQIANDLIVRVANGAVQMRAFVTSSNVDLDPASETSVRLVLQQLSALPGATLNNFTVQELADIAGSVNVLATAKQLAAGTNIENTVTTIQNAVAGNAGLTGFIVAAGAAGQTTQGPGDVGNHVPLTQGNRWQFNGFGGPPPVDFQNTRTISGTKTIGNVVAQVSSESNPANAGKAIDEYLAKDMIGVTNWGNNDVTDALTPQLVPYPELRFPLQPGSMFQAFNKQGANLGLDVDGDGKNETINTSAQVKVVGFETVVVFSAGTFSNVVRVETTVNAVVTFSRDGSTAETTETQTTWLASGVGPVKRTDVTQFGGVTYNVDEELASSLVNGSASGSGGANAGGGATNEVTTLALATNDLVYDKNRGKISTPGPSNPIGGSDITVIEFSQTASTLYGYATDTSPATFSTMAVTPSGVTVVSQTRTPSSVLTNDIVFDNGLIYTSAGYVINPTTAAIQGQFIGLPFNMIVRPDSSVGRVFFANGPAFGGGAPSLWAYDISSLQLIATTALGTIDIIGLQDLSSLIRWGTNGLAFRASGGQVFIIRTSLVP